MNGFCVCGDPKRHSQEMKLYTNYCQQQQKQKLLKKLERVAKTERSDTIRYETKRNEAIRNVSGEYGNEISIINQIINLGEQLRGERQSQRTEWPKAIKTIEKPLAQH